MLDAHEKRLNEIEKQKIEWYEKSLIAIAKDEDYFNIVEKLSVKLQNRLTDVIRALVFNQISSDKNLILAIEYFREKNGQITRQAPIGFLGKEEQESLWQKDGKFRISLYKALLFIHLTDAIKSGTLNLKYSYRCKSIHEYLIDQESWGEHRDQLIHSAGLNAFENYQKTMEKLKHYLGEKYSIVNKRFIEKRNPYLSVNDKGIVHVTTPAVKEKETEYRGAKRKPS